VVEDRTKQENGKIVDKVNQEELLHFHIIRSKKESQFTIEPFQAEAGFTIGPMGIFQVPKDA